MQERDIKTEDSTGLTAEEALEEAKRCMNCGCYAVNPSDVVPALVALNATIVTNKRKISAEEFCCTELKVSDVLQPGELVVRVEIPEAQGATMHYDKFRLRESVDFAIVSLATLFSTDDKGKFNGARVVFGGVAPVPIRARQVESFLLGKEANETTAKEAAELAVKNALPLEKNGYKKVELQAMIKRAILRM